MRARGSSEGCCYKTTAEKRSRHRRLSRPQWHPKTWRNKRQLYLRLFHWSGLQKIGGVSEITMSNTQYIFGQVAQRDFGPFRECWPRAGSARWGSHNQWRGVSLGSVGKAVPPSNAGGSGPSVGCREGQEGQASDRMAHSGVLEFRARLSSAPCRHGPSALPWEASELTDSPLRLPERQQLLY